MDTEKIMAIGRVDEMDFPFHGAGLDYMEELGLSPRISKTLVEAEMESMMEDLKDIGKALKVSPKISEAVAFEAIARAFSTHWKSCEGDLERAVTIACENLLEAV